MGGPKSEQLAKLQDANKKLRAQVRQLRKQLKEAEQNLLMLQEIWSAEISELKAFRQSRKPPKPDTICPSCGNDTLIKSTMGVWVLEKCESCEHKDKRRL
jgi:cell division septum initiation protein DivIVA